VLLPNQQFVFKYICIEGNIGNGKTTIAKRLSEELKIQFLGEEFENNPLLPLFYQHPEKYAFPLELSFLLDRYRQLKNSEFLLKNEVVVSDYFIEKCEYFASLNLSETEYQDFHGIYSFLVKDLKSPDLIIFIHTSAENALGNIKKRNRSFEANIPLEYLKKTAVKYEQNSQLDREAIVINFYLKELDSTTYERLFTEIVSLLKSGINAKTLTVQV